ncbi:MAG: hypothetical protein ACI9TH_003656 [Kiritimatiellia bacterium]|jgi:hypothetical protein
MQTESTHPEAAPSRRTFLRNVGATLALPFLDSALPRSAFAAAATTRPPLRMGIFTVTGGTVIESWKPEMEGALGKLPSILRPLEPLKDQLLVVSGLGQHGHAEGVNAHEHCAFVHLTCQDKVKKENGKIFTGVSMDQVAAGHVGHTSYLPSMELGLGNHETRYNFREGGVPIPYEGNPRLAFDRMFRNRPAIVPNWDRRTTQQGQAKPLPKDSAKTYDRSVLDLVLDEARALKGNLGKEDQQKFEEYLYSVRDIETRLERAEARLRMELLDLDDPGPADLHHPDKLPEDRSAGEKMMHAVGQNPEIHGEYIRLMSDLMVLAFQTDTTRVCTLALGSDGAMFPGVVTVGYEQHAHTLEHQGNAGNILDADPISREGCRQIHAWYTMLFSEMVRKMAAIDEGGSSLLDNSMILYTSYMSDGGHGRRDYPNLLVGKAGGTLKAGRHLAFQPETPVANLYVEMLDRMGVNGPFGNSLSSEKAAYNGRLPGLI